MCRFIKIAEVKSVPLPNWYVPRGCYINAARLAHENNGIMVDGICLNEKTGGVIAHRFVKTENGYLDFVGLQEWIYFAADEELWISSYVISFKLNKIVQQLNTKKYEVLPAVMMID